MFIYVIKDTNPRVNLDNDQIYKSIPLTTHKQSNQTHKHALTLVHRYLYMYIRVCTCLPV